MQLQKYLQLLMQLNRKDYYSSLATYTNQATIESTSFYNGHHPKRASDDCGIIGIFGSCQEKAQTNAKDIEKLGKYAIAIGTNKQQLANATDLKCFRISKDSALLHEVQNQIMDTQNQKWQKIETQFQVFRENIHVMRNCDQLLFT